MDRYQIIVKFKKQKDNILLLYSRGNINGRVCSALLSVINNQIKRLYMGL